MIIDELTLVGYKRLSLSALHGITIVPSKQMQLIIGTNGSGKSSLMAELSPLPANPAYYYSYGRKVFKCRHRGHRYELTSTFDPKPSHSFKRDDEELNDGGTITVQKELVKQDFELTQDLHDLLIGETMLTSMGPQMRRDWITRISQTNYDYALKAYQRIKTSARDQQGVVKHLANRLGQETNRLKQLGDLSGLEERVTQINDELRVLLANRKEGVADDRFDPAPIMSSLESDIEFCYSMVAYVPLGKDYRCMADVDADVERLTREVTRHRDLLDQYSRDYAAIEDTVNKLMKFQTQDGQETTLEGAMLALEQRIAETETSLTMFRGLTDATQVVADIQNALPQLVELFHSLPDNSSGEYTKRSLELLKERITEKQQLLDLSKNRLVRVEARIELISRANDITCPRCDYIWRPGFSEREYQELVDSASQTKEHLTTLEATLETDLEHLEAMESVGHLYRQLRTLIQAYPRLAPLWERVMDGGLHLNNPRSHIPLFYTLETDARTQTRLDELHRDRRELVQLQEGNSQSGEVGYFHQHMRDMNRRIEEHTQQLREVHSELTDIQAYRSKLVRLNTCLEGIEEKVKIIQQRSAEEIDRLRNEHIDTAMRHRYNQLGGFQNTLNEKLGIAAVIDDLKESHRTAELYAVLDKLLARAMSPSEGIIADELMSMIRAMTDRMNAIVTQVWSYDLKILPCEIGEGELDYKFPVYSAKNDLTATDISKGSKSQKRMIDLAFRLVVMFFLGFTEYPYYLDEQEEGMDDMHRVNLIGLVKLITELHPSSQVFMVSHYFSTYGSLSDTQTCVLDDSNIGVPDNANEHVTFL